MMLLLSPPEMDSFRILLYTLIFLLSVFGNLLIIIVLVMNKRMRTVTNSFLLSLAFSDLMMAIFCMPFTLIPNILEDFIFGAAMCKIISYFMGEDTADCFTCFWCFWVFCFYESTKLLHFSHLFSVFSWVSKWPLLINSSTFDLRTIKREAFKTIKQVDKFAGSDQCAEINENGDNGIKYLSCKMRNGVTEGEELINKIFLCSILHFS